MKAEFKIGDTQINLDGQPDEIYDFISRAGIVTSPPRDHS